MLSIDYKDWLLNQKRLPDKESSEAKAFFEFHKRLCLEGFTMDGVYFNPFLYWHLNLWNTEVDIIDEKGYISQKYRNPYFRDNEWLSTNAIDRANKEKKGLAIGGIRRFSKALRNDELLYTEYGTIQIGNVKEGDRIYDHTGQLTTVTGVFPQGKLPIYKITFEDNREIFCCENHIWRIKDKRYNKIKDLSVKELLKIYKKPRIHNGYKDGRTRVINEKFCAIPNNQCINYPKKQLQIDPYFLGLWLGDGSSRRIGITTVDEEISNYITEYAESLGLKVRQDKIEYIISSGIKGGTLNYNTLLTKFQNYNLIQNKHIPFDYLYSSEEDRMQLLRGLMDTDGTCSKNGTISYVTTNEKLAEDFFSLCRSLGINLRKTKFIPKLYGIECGEGWLFNLFTEKEVFNLTRKKKLIRKNVKGKQSRINWTTIRNIELVGEDEATCITVDNEDKLYLTTGYTVTHNSVLEASYIAWGATFDENSQNIISGLNSPDIKLITDKLDKGLNFLPWYYKWDRIEDNWKNQVTLGIKAKGGERFPFSSILIRNLDEGANEEAIAGTKPRKLIIDEGGKGPFLRGLQAAIPGFTTPFGWGCSPIVTFTGGDMKKFQDAKLLMFDVAAFNFLEFPNDKEPSRIHGLFIGHKYRLEAKVQSTFGDFIKAEEGSQFYDIPMQVSDEELAEKVTNENLERAKKSNDRAAYLKEKMYYPKEVDDIFLNEDTNIFDIDAAKRAQSRLLQNEHKGYFVEFFEDNGQIKYNFSSKLPINNFPAKPSDSLDAPVVIYEFPIENIPYGLNVSGVDSYRQGKAEYTKSLGTIYIFKRMHDILSDKYQNIIVASFAARPNKKEKWEEQARLLIKFYNARTLIENDEISFIDYLKHKGDAHYMEPQPKWLTSVVPNTTVNREYGLHRSAEKIRNYLHSHAKRYTEEVIFEQKDEEGNVIKRLTGMDLIPDPMLLEEIIQYNEDGNFDRLIAFELALAQAHHMDPIFGKATVTKNPYGKPKKYTGKLFNEPNTGLFPIKKSKLFT